MQLRDHEAVKGRRDEFQVDPRQLVIDAGFNVRDLDSKEERPALDELKEQIRGVGVQTALLVRMRGDEIVIVEGHRRHKVVLELIDEGEPIETVPVKHEAKGTNDAIRAAGLVTSNSGKPLTALQVAEVVRRLAGYGWDKAQIAKRLGWKSPRSVDQHLDMLAMPAELQAAVKRGETSATAARNAVKELGADGALKLIQDNANQGGRVKPRDVRQASGKTKPKPAPVKAATEPAAAPPRAAETVSAEQAAFSNGHGGRSEYDPPAEPPGENVLVLPARSVAVEPQVYGATDPSAAPPVAQRQLNGFFEAIKPLAVQLDDVNFDELADDDVVHFRLLGTEAKRFSAAWLKATGGEQS